MLKLVDYGMWYKISPYSTYSGMTKSIWTKNKDYANDPSIRQSLVQRGVTGLYMDEYYNAQCDKYSLNFVAVYISSNESD